MVRTHARWLCGSPPGTGSGALNAGGETYLMQTKLRGQSVMRLALGNILTTENNLRRVWKMIQDAATTFETASP